MTPPTEIAYTVPGQPCSWARKRVDARRGKPRFFTSAKQVNAGESHRWAAIAALRHARGTLAPAAAWPLTGAFAVEVRGYYASAVVADADRLASFALDALQGVAYETDRQVRRVVAEVHADGSPERVEVRVVRLAADPVQPKVRRRTGALTAKRVREKQASRDSDAESIRSGRRTGAEVRAANSMFANASKATINLEKHRCPK